jgi:hypothetical protein
VPRSLGSSSDFGACTARSFPRLKLAEMPQLRPTFVLRGYQSVRVASIMTHPASPHEGTFTR